jgi:hypothetical protein
MCETRKPAPIFAADIVGYSRLAGTEENRKLACLRGLRSDLFDHAIAVHDDDRRKTPAVHAAHAFGVEAIVAY